MQHNEEYDITAAFKRIEDELIASMIRNLDNHRAEEDDEGILWSQWQTEQLKSLEMYKLRNQKKYSKQFKMLNKRVEGLIQIAHDTGNMEQEIEILEAIKNGFKDYKKASSTLQGEFFRINERKLEALIEATTNDMKKAETAILRMANDKYRKVIFNAQVYAHTGAGTYEKAVDMATKDMLAAGLNCIEYANGARHTLSDYADMAIRTASKRAYLQGEGLKRQEWGITTVIMNKRGNPCPKCLPFVGKVMIDDVWSGGRAEDGDYPLMSYAISKGLYHPRCKDSHTTYFKGISTEDDTWTKEELEAVGLKAKNEARQQYAQRQEEKYGRLAKYSIDDENRKLYTARREQWRNIRFRTGSDDARGYAESKRPLANFHAVSQKQVVSILRQDAEEWIQNLTADEKRAIRKYTYNSGDKKPNRFFERLNAMLRGNIAEDKRLMEYADVISGALKRNKLKHDIICYRNLDFNPYEKYSVGDVFIENQFISTSVSSGAALDKEFKMIIFAPKGTRGAYIECISKYPNQREFLLDKDCKLRVISKQEDSIVLEVIR